MNKSDFTVHVRNDTYHIVKFGATGAAAAAAWPRALAHRVTRRWGPRDRPTESTAS